MWQILLHLLHFIVVSPPSVCLPPCARCIVWPSILFLSLPFLSFFWGFLHGRPPVGLRGWGSLTTAMAAIPPTQERMAWHLPELRNGNAFFFLKWHCWSIHGLKDPHWAPQGRLHASPLSPFRWGLVITGMEVRPGLIHTRGKVLRQRTSLSFASECLSIYP